jgi:branched-chain amino acid transport system substrate-binding protein
MKKIGLLASLLVILLLSSAAGQEAVKLGIISALSGPIQTDPGAIHGAQMAVDEFGPIFGKKVELIVKDHAYNPGLANERAKELLEKDKVDGIVGCPNSAAAMAVSDQAARYKKVFICTDAGSTALIARNRYTVKWIYNDYMLANTLGRWGAKNLGKRWYTITSDYAWGHDLLKNFTAALTDEGGVHAGNDMVALGTSDYSPYILKAIKADPDVLVLLNVGKDCVNSTKAAFEYGLKKKAKVVHAILLEFDITGAGIETFVGDYVASPWNWQASYPGVKEFADRYYKRYGYRPHYFCAGDYSAAWHYMSAVKRAGSTDSEKVLSALRGYSFKDFFSNPGYIRPDDQLLIAPVYLLRVKNPAQLREKEDYFEVVGTYEGEKAHPPAGFFGRKVQ